MILGLESFNNIVLSYYCSISEHGAIQILPGSEISGNGLGLSFGEAGGGLPLSLTPPRFLPSAIGINRRNSAGFSSSE